ncbi:MAG: phosphodiester glycosidase family protein [Clostridia bacterium]|nr:phosphodiester glycosidase family protein [Clostridia bacterium]
MMKTKTGRILCRTGIALSFVLCFAVAAAALIFPLAFSGAYPNLAVTLTETFSVSRGTQFLVRTFRSDAEIREVMEAGLYYSKFPEYEDLSAFADPADFEPEKRIEYFTLRGTSFVGHVLVIHDPTAVKLFVTPDLGTQGYSLSEYNERLGLAAGINAGGYLDNDTLLGKGGIPAGSVIAGGEIVWQAETPEEKENLIGFTEDGVLVFGSWTAEEAVERFSLRDAVSFRPALVCEGEGLIREGTGGYGYAPRSAIGQRADGAVIFVMLEGRRPSSIGATLLDVQNVLLDYGAYTGAMLDGGSCATLVFNDGRVSRPVDFFGERPVPSVFGVTLSDFYGGDGK